MKMKKIYNKIIPFKGFTALTVWPFIFVRFGKTLTKRGERHETTHAKQQIEMTVVGLFLAISMFLFDCGWYSLIPVGLFIELYCLEWLVKLPLCGFFIKKSYLSISFEQEAYDHQEEVYYNEVRKDFAWLRYLFTITTMEI